MFLLDTDICIAILRGKEPDLESKLNHLPLASVEVPSIVVAELWVGVEKSSHRERSERKLRTFLRDIPTVPFEESAALKYGEIRAQLERGGTSIGANDLLIAAMTVVRFATLITRNRREYGVPGLKIEVW